MIHHHFASHEHFDLRLEMNGVLKSWAIPKEPPKTQGTKRLAILVDDHALSYAKFHGTIPKGSYGAGKVKIWDSGSYELLEKTKDKFMVNIKGRKLKGVYYITKFRTAGKKNWLFFKKKDQTIAKTKKSTKKKTRKKATKKKTRKK